MNCGFQWLVIQEVSGRIQGDRLVKKDLKRNLRMLDVSITLKLRTFNVNPFSRERRSCNRWNLLPRHDSHREPTVVP